MSEVKITQGTVDDIFKEIKVERDAMVDRSGRNEKMFIATDNTGECSNFTYKYQCAKDHVESIGLVMPVLVEGLTVNIGE